MRRKRAKSEKGPEGHPTEKLKETKRGRPKERKGRERVGEEEIQRERKKGGQERQRKMIELSTG